MKHGYDGSFVQLEKLHTLSFILVQRHLNKLENMHAHQIALDGDECNDFPMKELVFSTL